MQYMEWAREKADVILIDDCGNKKCMIRRQECMLHDVYKLPS